MICARSLCVSTEVTRTFVRQAKYGQLSVMCGWASEAMLAAVCSAVAEAASIEKLSFVMGTTEYQRVQVLNPLQWGWLVYGLCSKESDASYCTLGIAVTKFPLTRQFVSVAAAVLRTNYPEPVPERDSTRPPEYGYVDVPEGTTLCPIGLADGAEPLILSRSWRCRALYDPATMTDCVNVIVPGHGICKMSLDDADRSKQFVRDATPESTLQSVSRCIRSLYLKFSKVENERLVKELLNLIGASISYA